MKPQELRIGNWVADRGGKQWQIYSFDGRTKVEAEPMKVPSAIAGMCDEAHPYTEDVKCLQPIPLTESWWERAGGFFDEDLGWVLDLPCGASFSRNESGVMYYMGNMESFWVDILMEIEYVHQLQNLVFDLTGTELEFLPEKP